MRVPSLAGFMAVAAFACGARAADDPLSLNALCTPHGERLVVDRAKLADGLLAKYRISTLALRKYAGQGRDLTDSRVIIALGDICSENPGCSDADKASVQTIKGWLDGVLQRGLADVQVTRVVSREAFMAQDGPEDVLVCRSTSAKPIIAPPPTQVVLKSGAGQLRVRGRLEDLTVDAADATAFAATLPAKLSLSGDNLAHTRADTLALYVGYAIAPFDAEEGAPYSLALVPYVAANRSSTRSTMLATAPVVTSTFELGLQTNWLWVNGTRLGNQLSVTPRFLDTTSNGAQVFSLNGQYTPYAGWLNDFRPLFGRESKLWLEPILDARLDTGAFIDRGVSSVAATHQDYFRAGGSVGLALVSDYPQLPASLTLSYVQEKDFAGGPDVRYFISSLNLYFNAAKQFGLGLSYSDGHRQDTLVEEQKWSASLTAKY